MDELEDAVIGEVPLSEEELAKKPQRIVVPLSMVDINDLQEGEELVFTFLATKEGIVDLVMRRETEEDLKNINL